MNPPKCHLLINERCKKEINNAESSKRKTILGIKTDFKLSSKTHV